MPITLTPSSPVGRYATLADWDNFAGTLNVVAYSDKDGAGTIDAAAIQAAMDYADDQVESALQSVYAVPLSPVNAQIRYWATVIGVGRYAYFGRGLSDTDKTGDKFAKLVAQVYREMRQALGPPNLLPCALRSGVSFAATAVDPQAARNSVRPTWQRVWGGW